MKISPYLIAFFVSGCTGAGGCEGPGQPVSTHVSRASIVQNVAQARLSQQGFEFLESDLMTMVQAILNKPLAVKIPRTPIPEDSPFVTLCDRPGGCDATMNVIPGSLDIRRLPPDETGVSRLYVNARFEVSAENILTVAGDAGHPERDCRVDIAVKDHYADVCQRPGKSWARASNIYNPTDANWASHTVPECNAACDAPNPGRAVSAAILISVDPALGYPRVSVESLQLNISASQYCPALNDLRVTQPKRALGAACADGTTACALFDSTILAQAPVTCLLINSFYDTAKALLFDSLAAGAKIAINGQINEFMAVHCTSDDQCQQGATCKNTVVSAGFGCGVTGCLLDPVEAKVCQVGGSIVPPLVGFERELNMNTLDQKYNPNSVGAVKVVAGVGGYLSTDNNDDEDKRGVTISGFFGVETERSPCVAPKARPTIHEIKPLVLDAPVTLYDSALGQMVERQYHASISLHQDALNQLAWALYTNGAMCVTLNTNDASDEAVKIDSNLLSVMFPSLVEIFGRDVHPALLQVVPGDLPVFTIGRGELEEDANHQLIVKSPHATLDMKKIRLEMYGQVAQRYVRLFTIEADFKIGVFFEFTDDNKLRPFATDVREGLGPVTIDNVVILGETREQLQKNLPQLLDLALPLAAKAILKEYELPKATVLPGYELKMVGLTGSRQIGTSNDYEFISAFGKLQAIPAAGVGGPAREAEAAPSAQSELVSIEGATLFSAPKVSVHLSSDTDGSIEYAYRLNNGMWTLFSRASDITLQREQLRINGKHTLEVKARRMGQKAEGPVSTLTFDMATKAAVIATSEAPQQPDTQGCSAAGASPSSLVLTLLAAMALRHAARRRRSALVS